MKVVYRRAKNKLAKVLRRIFPAKKKFDIHFSSLPELSVVSFLPTNIGRIGWYHTITTGGQSDHPFILALRACGSNCRCISEYLYNYYLDKQISCLDTHEILSDNFTSDDLDCLVLPWECEKNSIGNFLSARHSNRWRENRIFGFNSTKSLINAGSDLKKVSDLEAKRLKTLLESVKSSGFKEDTYSPITVTLLKKDGSYRYYVNGGNHRVAVLAYLGLSHIPAVSTRQVSYCEAESWLGVASGLFELQHAKEVLNRSFSGVGWQRSD